MIFSVNFLRNKLGLPYDGDVVLDEIESQGRWETHHRLVFEYDGKLYETNYSKGSTEYQDCRPWENETSVECWEVERYEKTITDYRPV